MSEFVGMLSEDGFQVLRIGLKRTDESEVEIVCVARLPSGVGALSARIPCRIAPAVIDRRSRGSSKEIFECLRRSNRREPVLAALFSRFDGNLLPFVLFLRRRFRVQIDHSPLGHQWTDL